MSRRGLLRAGLTTGVAAASAALPIAAVYGSGPQAATADPHTAHQVQQPGALGGFTYFKPYVTGAPTWGDQSGLDMRDRYVIDAGGAVTTARPGSA